MLRVSHKRWGDGIVIEEGSSEGGLDGENILDTHVAPCYSLPAKGLSVFLTVWSGVACPTTWLYFCTPFWRLPILHSPKGWHFGRSSEKSKPCVQAKTLCCGQYSSGRPLRLFSSFSLGAGITLAIDHQFRMAYTFFVLFGLWSILSWLLSDTLRQARSHRVIVKYAGIVVIIAFSGWWINWVHDLHLELIADRLEAARQETFDKLTVVPVPLLSQDSSDQIAMSITNVAHWELDQHRLDCQISSLSYTNHAVFSQAFIHGHSTKQMGLLGGGRGEVAYCDIPMGGPPDAGVACIDMDVQVTFALLEQPNESMVKPYRFSGGLGPMGLTWIQQSLGGKTICAVKLGKRYEIRIQRRSEGS